MARSIFKGDRVRTPFGDGIIVDAQSWREKLLDMSDAEAREFSDQCRVEVGLNFMEEWVELLVKTKHGMRRMLGHQVTVLEGRNGKTD